MNAALSQSARVWISFAIVRAKEERGLSTPKIIESCRRDLHVFQKIAAKFRREWDSEANSYVEAEIRVGLVEGLARLDGDLLLGLPLLAQRRPLTLERSVAKPTIRKDGKACRLRPLHRGSGQPGRPP